MQMPRAIVLLAGFTAAVASGCCKQGGHQACAPRIETRLEAPPTPEPTPYAALERIEVEP